MALCLLSNYSNDRCRHLPVYWAMLRAVVDMQSIPRKAKQNLSALTASQQPSCMITQSCL